MKTYEEINKIAPYEENEWQQGYGIWQAGYMEGQKACIKELKEVRNAFIAFCYNIIRGMYISVEEAAKEQLGYLQEEE